jgi:protein-S-isoprenylcysteine O-methyltransferase Ste14
MIDVVLIHFSILFLGITLNLIALILTLYLKNVQIWPPPGKFSSQFWFTWISFTYFMMGIPVLGILDYGSLEISDLPRFISAGILFLIAFPVGISAMYQLSFKQTLGLKGKFTTSGVYRFTRNPQYVTHVLLIAAIVLATNSSLALIVGIPYSLWFILAPFAEEKWLKDQFGEEYDSYCHRVPRFIGFPKNR